MTSTIKVNNVQNQCGANIINENSNTITIGASGDTIALASGASQTGFGRTGTVDWQTGDIKTATFTAENGKGYFCNTTAGAFTVNLPASPSAGDIVAVADYAGTAETNNITIARNGSNFEGGTDGGEITTNRQTATFVYVDGTQGWIAVNSNDSSFIPETFITATGGTITCCGSYKIHTFTGPGTFTVSQVASCSANNKVDYLVVAGGGGGGGTNCTSGGAGGAGGFRYYANTTNNPQTGNPASPINNFPAGTAITVTATGFPITVGSGGTAGPDVSGPTVGGTGGVSTFSTVTSAGGGGGHGYKGATPLTGAPGGSGGGGSYGGGGGPGNNPPVSPPQGNNGGSGDNSPQRGGGGGGAIAVGTPATGSQTGDGGAGAGVTGFGASNGECSSCKQYFSGGGGGGTDNTSGGTGGLGGGANGGQAASGGNGTANTGGGGGGSQASPPGPRPGGTGGSGIVVIRYKYQ